MGKCLASGLVVLLCTFALQGQQAGTASQDSGPGAVNPGSPAASLPPFTAEKRLQKYLYDTYGPLAYLGPGFWGAMDQARNEPFEWGGGAAGYGRRFGSRFGRNGIENTIQFGIAALDGEDYRYRPTHRKGVLPRAYGAAFQTLFPGTTRGHRTLAFSLLAGTFGSGLISNTWYPDRQSTVGDGMMRGASALGGDVGVNIFWEFWPDIKKEIKKKVLHRK